MHKVIKRGDKPIIEQLENKNVLITKFLLTGETETVIKAGADQKVKEIYKKLGGGMKTLFALYDKDDNFIDCGFSLAEIGIPNGTSWELQNTIKKRKLYRIPLEIQDDIFKAEDEAFIKEFEEKCYTSEEQAQKLGVSVRTIFRRKAKKLKGKVGL